MKLEARSRLIASAFTFSGGRILNSSGEELGILFSQTERNFNLSKLIPLFEGYQFKGWTLPDRFDFVYLDKLRLANRLRGRGFGKEILSQYFASFRRPTLIGLVPGELSTNVPYDKILKFYRSCGMYETRIKGELWFFAFSESYKQNSGSKPKGHVVKR